MLFKIIFVVTLWLVPVFLQSPIDECENPACPEIGEDETEWALTILPVPSDCTRFILCQRGIAHVMKCAPPLHYNREKETCDRPEEADCIECQETPPAEPEPVI